jgi:serine/alanine adding enzyme
VTKLDICELEKKDEMAWDDYILKSEHSTFYHQIGWRNVVEKTYKHKPIYLIAKEEGEIKGVLPLFLMKSMFFGKKLVSVPFAPYGGVCADDELIEKALIEEAKRITKEYGADYLELRQFNGNETRFVTNDAYVTSILKLDKNPDVMWTAFRKSMRRYVRKAVKNNFHVTKNSKNLEDFYNIYSQNMRNLGTPAHSYSFFRNILHDFPEYTKIATIEYRGKVISTIFLLYFKNTVIYGWGASLREYLELNPNYLLFWEIIKYSCEKCLDFFDFGRSQPNTGVFLFKEGWGAEPKQLYYQFYLNKVKKMPDTGQSNPKRQKFAKVWSKLPLHLANKVGPILRSNIP